MPAQKNVRPVHYVLSTHWDREWYQSFQNYRFRLVQLMDRVIAGLEDGRLKGPFQTDGQSVILEDYLEIRPEMRGKIEKLAQEGKLRIGPWYDLPDEFLVSGESIIRNIRLGREIARTFTVEPSHIGFACDLFGHISQLPQLFAGFGIDVAYLWRGINLYGVRNFIWEGADDTKTTCFLFRNGGYCDYSFRVRDFGNHDDPFDAEARRKRLADYIKEEASETEIEPVLLFDGADHQEWDIDMYPLVEERMEKPIDGTIVEHVGLDDHAALMRRDKKKIKNSLKGELREPGMWAHKSPHQIHGVLSSRAWIKQWNAKCENLLTLWAEPISAYTQLTLGHEYAPGYFDKAWRYLLQNHPHDSICGCSVDEVHEDMKYRFAQSEQIAERIVIDAMDKLTACIEGELGEKEIRIGVFNPLPRRFKGVTHLRVRVPLDYPHFNEFFGFELKPAFKIYNAEGKEIPYQRVAQDMDSFHLRVHYWEASSFDKYNDITVALEVDVPATGYTSLTLKPGEYGVPVRHPANRGMATSRRSMENAHLAVSVEANGTLKVTDKATGEVYTDVLAFDDCADIGDGWFHGIPVADQVYISTSCAADVAIVEDGALSTAFRIRVPMWLPKCFDFKSMRRSEERAEVMIDSIVRLRKGARHLEVETTVHNTAKDHRMRVLVSTHVRADQYETDSPFDAVRRDVALRDDNHLHMEMDVEPRPMQAWCAVAKGKRGMAVISTGQYEACVRDADDRAIAMTLFRGTSRTVGTNGQPEGQLLGDQKFRYWIKPLPGKINRTELFHDGQAIATGLKYAHCGPRDLRVHHDPSKPQKKEASFFEIKGDVVCTSSRTVNGGFEVRLFNPNDKPAGADITIYAKPLPYKKAHLVDFESKPVTGEVKYAKGKASTKLGPKKIVTVRFS